MCTYGALKHYLADPFDFRAVSQWLPANELDAAEPWPRHRSAEEIRRVLARADLEAQGGPWEARRLRAAVYTFAFTGAHKSEVLGLRVRDLDPVLHTVAFRSHPRRRLKTVLRSAVLPLAEPLAAVLAGWLPEVLERFPRGEYLFPHHFGTGPWLSGRPGHRPLDCVRALGERAGVPGLTIVAFRHSLATLAESWGIGELALQRILRHARRRTQDAYRHPDLDLMREAIGRVKF